MFVNINKNFIVRLEFVKWNNAHPLPTKTSNIFAIQTVIILSEYAGP